MPVARGLPAGAHAPKSATRVGERIVGTKGVSDCAGMIQGEKPFNFSGDKIDPFVSEHTDLIKSIRAGAPLMRGSRRGKHADRDRHPDVRLHRARVLLGMAVEFLQAGDLPKEIKPGPGLFPPVAIPGRRS